MTRETAMKKTLLAAALLATATAALAEASPVGLWRNIDDKSGQPRAEIRISEQGGVLSGRIVKRLLAAPDSTGRCDECKDERKGQPIEGMEIIRGARKVDGKDTWEGGRILDPENGREYALRMTPVDGGRKLDVRGSIGPFGRTQTWVRVE